MCHAALDIAESIVKYYFKQWKFSPGDVDGVGYTVGINVIAMAVMLCAGIKNRISKLQWTISCTYLYRDMLYYDIGSGGGMIMVIQYNI